MSADNTIVIGIFPNEILVAHVQAVENLDDHPLFSKRSTDLHRFLDFHNAPSTPDLDSALDYAGSWVREIEEGGGYVEYGVCVMTFDRELLKDLTYESALQELNEIR